MVALDRMEKTASLAVIQAEWNDMLGAVIKFTGAPADVTTALEAGKQAAENFLAKAVGAVLMRPTEDAMRVIISPPNLILLSNKLSSST